MIYVAEPFREVSVLDLKQINCGVAYDHIGIPSTESSEGEVYQPDIKAHVCRIGGDALRVEKIRFDADAPFPDDIKNRPHVAFKFDSLDEAVSGKRIVMPPTELTPGIRFAFVSVFCQSWHPKTYISVAASTLKSLSTAMMSVRRPSSKLGPKVSPSSFSGMVVPARP